MRRTVATLVGRLLEFRTRDGHWEGRLSISALSTATAAIALMVYDRKNALAGPGLEWLIARQNKDGGWGDTTVSFSNPGTTLLCWSALCASRDPLFRLLRSALRSRTLEVASAMQPESGGYLEATPLTAFVTMSLIHAGRENHPIAANGIRFLVNSARPDGSWPIDTNLAWILQQLLFFPYFAR